jgi:hypothetical protein
MQNIFTFSRAAALTLSTVSVAFMLAFGAPEVVQAQGITGQCEAYYELSPGSTDYHTAHVYVSRTFVWNSDSARVYESEFEKYLQSAHPGGVIANGVNACEPVEGITTSASMTARQMQTDVVQVDWSPASRRTASQLPKATPSLGEPTVCAAAGWRPSEDHGAATLPKYVYVSGVFNTKKFRTQFDRHNLYLTFANYVKSKYGMDANNIPDLNLDQMFSCIQGQQSLLDRFVQNATNTTSQSGASSVQLIQTYWALGQ